MTKKPDLRKVLTCHISEFSRRAKSYTQYNIIQKQVVHELMKNIGSKPKRVLDLGCGTGAVYELIDWDITQFTGIEKAGQMCALHPKNAKIRLLHEDFEDETVLQNAGHFDMVISSSAIQWAQDLPKLLQNISKITDEVAFAIFCEGTFKTIYEMTGLQSFLPSHEMLLKTLEQYFAFDYEIKRYQLHFPDNISKFRYIKQSGVSGGKRKLNVTQTRRLIKTYPLEYLEFEVFFCWGSVKR